MSRHQFGWDLPPRVSVNIEDAQEGNEAARKCQKCGTRQSWGWYTMNGGRTLCDDCGDAEINQPRSPERR
jgi:hypothetical protein